jgi:hypothetical protein
MSVFIHHDKQGNIVSYFIPSKQAADQVEMIASKGQLVTAVDAADVKEISLVEEPGDRSHRLATVTAALQRYKVDIRGKKLVSK